MTIHTGDCAHLRCPLSMCDCGGDKRSWDEWRSAGFAVVKGQKAVGRNEKGERIFSVLQVTRMEKRLVRGRWVLEDEIRPF